MSAVQRIAFALTVYYGVHRFLNSTMLTSTLAKAIREMQAPMIKAAGLKTRVTACSRLSKKIPLSV
jgi:hypothetical protein